MHTSYELHFIERAFALAERLINAVEKIADNVEAIQHDVSTLASAVTEVDDYKGHPLGKALKTTNT